MDRFRAVVGETKKDSVLATRPLQLSLDTGQGPWGQEVMRLNTWNQERGWPVVKTTPFFINTIDKHLLSTYYVSDSHGNVLNYYILITAPIS